MKWCKHSAGQSVGFFSFSNLKRSVTLFFLKRGFFSMKSIVIIIFIIIIKFAKKDCFCLNSLGHNSSKSYYCIFFSHHFLMSHLFITVSNSNIIQKSNL
ncbi:unnamed protein product [Phytomonas sp. EM1]|nr:unnamed protein product [Phytomonas sp. EM1]|eukprot:CCW64580.1 unnamed protein product [Phytomonas sp. isolate EM1]